MFLNPFVGSRCASWKGHEPCEGSGGMLRDPELRFPGCARARRALGHAASHTSVSQLQPAVQKPGLMPKEGWENSLPTAHGKQIAERRGLANLLKYSFFFFQMTFFFLFAVFSSYSYHPRYH